jgi:molecular chaperone GrpE
VSDNAGDETNGEEVTSSQDDVTVEPEADDLFAETESEFSAIETERDSYKEMAQRLQADFENYRKRSAKESAEASQRGAETLVVKLLGVLDTIDLAKAHDPNGTLEQVSSTLMDILQKEGLERIPAVDQPFDPTLHEAVAHEPGDGDSRVSEELRAGYRWKGRVIRPAMVKVIG